MRLSKGFIKKIPSRVRASLDEEHNMSGSQSAQDETLKANIYVHSFLANNGEYQKSPHLRPENVARVRTIIARLTENLPLRREGSRAIDFGCGTGFIIDLIHERFAEVHGVDITLDMMKHINLAPGNIFLHESLAEKTHFPNNSFDFATAYSFMDHLLDYQIFLREVFRVLKPGGIFYSDLNPNRDFILSMADAEKGLSFNSSIVEREIQGALHNGKFHETDSGVNAGLIEKAEPIKSYDKGFDAAEVLVTAQEIGFSKVRVEFEWFIGQGKIMHEDSVTSAQLIDKYLSSVLPVSSHLYKYLRFVFVK